MNAVTPAPNQPKPVKTFPEGYETTATEEQGTGPFMTEYDDPNVEQPIPGVRVIPPETR